jgi:hypothetical protein
MTFSQATFGRARAALLLAGCLSCCFAGPLACSKNKESIVTVGGDKKLSAEEIDRDPLALLPGGAVVVAQVDAQAFLASSVGPSSLRVAQNLVPLTAEMNFKPERDLKTLYAGVYSMTGADTAVVAQGTYDVDAIKRAAERGSMTAMGKPLRKVEYASNDLYMTGDLGFVLLTPKTLLSGNPTGIRRALDRIRDARVKREIPDWAEAVLKTPNAQIAIAGDTSGQSIPQAIVGQVPFLNGIKTLRLIGNFQPPGMNFAGSLTYPDAATAANGESQIKSVAQLAGLLNWLSPFGVSSPLRSLDTRVQASDVQVLAAVDGQALSALLNQLGMITAFVGPLAQPAQPTQQPFAPHGR